MEKIQQSYAAVLAGLGGRESLAGIPAERLAVLKEQFERLKELLGSMLTFRGRPPKDGSRASGDDDVK
jgi:hypothetical protein